VIVVLTGGTGGAKFVEGLSRVLSPKELTVIVNTGDDLTWWGLHVSPDLDSITYALAGKLSKERGWGVEGDTFRCLEAMRRLGAPDWFQLGDLDLATHLTRTSLLSAGKTLTQATAEIAISYGVKSQVLPMTDDRVETRVRTEDSELLFQEYFVRERYQPNVCGVRFAGAGEATPTDAVLGAIADAETIFVAPSNPITSIGPILAVPGIRSALTASSAPKIGVSPIIGASAISCPAHKLMKACGREASALGVAQGYEDFLDTLLIAAEDKDMMEPIAKLRLHAVATDIFMTSSSDKRRLARQVLALAGK